MNSNFRLIYFSLFLLIGMLVQTVAADKAPIINVSQSSTSDRIIQIEKAVNFRGKLLYQIQQQLSNIQLEIDLLRGQIQENQHQLSKIIVQQKELYTQFNSFEITSNKLKINTKNDNINNTISYVKPTNEKAEYNIAVAIAIKSRSKQQIAQAIIFFQNFIKTYPKSNYQPNVNYWLGQLNYNQGNKDDAAFYFATVVKNYPNSPKGAESLYKIGLLMQEKGKNDKARIIYQQVIKAYPGSPSAKLAQKKLTVI
ncbi:MAG: tol-pal system protein YbgF [Arsenophonus sp.]